MFRKIVVGVDGSEPAKTALRIACDLARRYDGELALVHVPEADTTAVSMAGIGGYYAAVTSPALSEIEMAGARVMQRAQDIAKEEGCARVSAHVAPGEADPATEIVAHADRIGADLIVTGRRGLGGMTGLLLGSTTRKINTQARCACLSIA